MMNSTPWLYVIPGVFTFAFFLAALIYVSLKKGDGSNSKSLAMVGLGIFLAVQISNFLIRPLISQLSASADFRAVYALYSGLASLMSITGYSFLIAAIFAGRKVSAADIPRHFGGAGVSDENPYSASSL